MNSVADVWTNVLQQLKKDLSETTITTWFDELTAVDIRENTFYLHCPNDFKKRYIESLFIKNIKAALQDLFSMEFEVKILDEAGLLEFQGGAPKKNSDRFTYEDFTFETFVVGPSNKLAYAASMAVAEHPAQNYNPLLIYGDSGLGKTHLLYAIANVIRQNDPAAKIVYIKGDDFINEFIELIRAGRGSDFRAKYREADLLLVDDVQFIAGKKQTQEEFFHTFNTLYESGRQIVLTSDRPPSEMTQLEDRLRTRFEWGLTADIQPPDFETRVAIVKRKAELLNLDLPDDVAEYIANHLKQNIRQLEGAVKKLNAYYMLEGIAPCIGVTTTAIKDTLNDTQPIPVTIEKIINEVARTYNVIPSDIRGKKRSANVSAARQMSMYIIREITGMSMEAIGSEFQRDHSTVVYSINTMEKNIGKDRHLKETVDDIMKNIRA
mgnify:CR=1 FL=1